MSIELRPLKLGDEMNEGVFENERVKVLEYLRAQLVGPAESVSEVLDEPPTKRYAMGILFPQESDCAHVNEDEEQDEQRTVAEQNEATDESPISLAFQRLPASMGISFFVIGAQSTLSCEVWGSRYERIQGDPSSKKDGPRRRQ